MMGDAFDMLLQSLGSLASLVLLAAADLAVKHCF